LGELGSFKPFVAGDTAASRLRADLFVGMIPDHLVVIGMFCRAK